MVKSALNLCKKQVKSRLRVGYGCGRIRADAGLLGCVKIVLRIGGAGTGAAAGATTEAI